MRTRRAGLLRGPAPTAVEAEIEQEKREPGVREVISRGDDGAGNTRLELQMMVYPTMTPLVSDDGGATQLNCRSDEPFVTVYVNSLGAESGARREIILTMVTLTRSVLPSSSVVAEVSVAGPVPAGFLAATEHE